MSSLEGAGSWADSFFHDPGFSSDSFLQDSPPSSRPSSSSSRSSTGSYGSDGSYESTDRAGSRGSSAQVSTATAKYAPLSKGPSWHLPEDWNWTGDSNSPLDVVCEHGLEVSVKEWSMFLDSAVLGHASTAVVTRVICNSKVLARKTVRIRPRFPEEHLREMQILRKLKHQHIVQICGTYTLKSRFNTLIFPVAEMDLSNFMAHRPIYVNWIKTLTAGLGCLSNALAYIHAADIKHRDIKPTNILVKGDILIFSDFGGAVDFSARESGSKSEDLIGMTRLYAPPEALQSEDHGRSGDVFSLGLVMTEMVDNMFRPNWPSSVERRLAGVKAGRIEHAYFIPKPMTTAEDEFLQNLPSAGKRISIDDEDLSRSLLDLLFAVMMAEDATKRPPAHDVWAYLKLRTVGVVPGGFPACGQCCE